MRKSTKWLLKSFKVESVRLFSEYLGFTSAEDPEEQMGDYDEMIPRYSDDTVVEVAGVLFDKKVIFNVKCMGYGEYFDDPMDISVGFVLDLIGESVGNPEDTGLGKIAGLGDKTIKEFILQHEKPEEDEEELIIFNVYRDAVIIDADNDDAYEGLDDLFSLDIDEEREGDGDGIIGEIDLNTLEGDLKIDF